MAIANRDDSKTVLRWIADEDKISMYKLYHASSGCIRDVPKGVLKWILVLLDISDAYKDKEPNVEDLFNYIMKHTPTFSIYLEW